MEALQQEVTKAAERLRARVVIGERAVEHVVVLPLLRVLGWDPADDSDMAPEYPVEGGRVDWALGGSDSPLVFVELKAPDQDLDAHEEQLLNYAFRGGAPLAVLTNGSEWRLYLSMGQGTWSERRFCRVSLTDGEHDQTCRDLHQFLEHEAVLTGSATEAAEHRLRESRDLERIRRLIPAALQKILDPPAQSLLVFLQRELQETLGSLAPVDAIRDGLAGMLSTPQPTAATSPRQAKRSTQQRRTTPVPAPPKHNAEQSANATESLPDPYSEPVAMILDGRHTPVVKWREVLSNTAEWLLAHGYALPVDVIIGRKRTLVSATPSALTAPHELSNGLWLETNYSARDCVHRARWLMEQAGLHRSLLQVEYRERAL